MLYNMFSQLQRHQRMTNLNTKILLWTKTIHNILAWEEMRPHLPRVIQYITSVDQVIHRNEILICQYTYIHLPMAYHELDYEFMQ